MWIQTFLDDPRCPVKVAVDWSTEIALHAVIRGVVSTKAAATGLSEQVIDRHLVPLVLHTFLAVYEYAARFRNEKLPLHFVHLPAMIGLDGSQLLKGVVLLDRQWPVVTTNSIGVRVASPLKSVVVALFNVTIDPRLNGEGEADGITVEASDESQHVEFRLAALRQFADTLVKCGVTAVMSQKIIPSYLQTYLLSKGIFSLDRLASSHIRAVQMLSGASLLSDWRIDHDPGELSEAFGFLSLISIERVTRIKTFIRLERHPGAAVAASVASADRSWPVSTVVIGTPDGYAYEEIVECFNTALKVLSQVLGDPEVVAGAGCTEVHLAAWLQRQADSLVLVEQTRTLTAAGGSLSAQTRMLRQLRVCVKTCARAMTRVAGILSQEQRGYSVPTLLQCDAYTGPIVEQIESMNRPRLGWEHVLHAASNQRILYGWNPAMDAVDEVLAYEWHNHEKIVTKARVLDSLECKRNAIAYAVECALVLMRVGSVVKVQ